MVTGVVKVSTRFRFFVGQMCEGGKKSCIRINYVQGSQETCIISWSVIMRNYMSNVTGL